MWLNGRQDIKDALIGHVCKQMPDFSVSLKHWAVGDYHL
jgi:hypothetical protein